MTIRAVAIGVTAHAALARADGVGHVLARLSTSTYLTVAGEIVWLAGVGAPRHPRAILTAETPRAERDRVRIEVGAHPPWRPPVPAPERLTASTLAARWREVAVPSLGTPAGFGVLLAGRPLTFPLDGARGPAESLAHACTRDEPAAAAEAALALLGLGGGLTPSGDDYVGGAFFARGVIAAAGAADADAWRRAADRVLAAARTRTHPISAALLADLAGGASWAPLHDVIDALAAGTPGAAHAAARRLVTLGHSSGWDMLAGVGAGLGTLAR